MKRILVDTNIVIDLLAQRDPFYAEAAKLFSMADNKEIRLSISALTITTTSYILSKQLNSVDAKSAIRKLKLLVTMVDLNNKIIDLALNDKDFDDFEDALQYYSAIENKNELIITRNLRDFKKSKIPIMTADQFIKIK